MIKIFGYILWPCLRRTFYLISRKSPPIPNFTNDIVLITGAAQGLGKELALQFSKCGATLVLWDIDKSRLDQTCSEIKALGCEVFPYVVDCSNRHTVYRTAAQVREDVGNVSVLVNNAGIVQKETILEESDDAAEKTFKVNTFSHFWVSKLYKAYTYYTPHNI